MQNKNSYALMLCLAPVTQEVLWEKYTTTVVDVSPGCRL